MHTTSVVAKTLLDKIVIFFFFWFVYNRRYLRIYIYIYMCIYSYLYEFIVIYWGILLVGLVVFFDIRY